MNEPLRKDELQALCARAQETALHAYAPYSRFRVGAAVSGRHGIYVGANVENASYGLAICAERVALATAIAAGDNNIRAVAVACIDADPTRDLEEFVPCGACRQWLVELAPSAQIIVCGKDKIFSIHDLLPIPFRLTHPEEKDSPR